MSSHASRSLEIADSSNTTKNLLNNNGITNIIFFNSNLLLYNSDGIYMLVIFNKLTNEIYYVVNYG